MIIGASFPCARFSGERRGSGARPRRAITHSVIGCSIMMNGRPTLARHPKAPPHLRRKSVMEADRHRTILRFSGGRRACWKAQVHPFRRAIYSKSTCELLKYHSPRNAPSSRRRRIYQSLVVLVSAWPHNVSIIKTMSSQYVSNFEI